MSESLVWTIRLSSDEFYLLAALLKLPDPMAPEDPLQGCPQDQAIRRARQAQETLAARRFLEVEDADSVTVDAAVAAVIQAACSSPRTFFFSSANSDGMLVERFIHQTESFAVEQECQRDGRVTLTALFGADVLKQRTRDLMNLKDMPSAPGSEIVLDPATLSDIQRAIVDGNQAECRRILCDHGASKENAELLLSGLHEIRTSGSLTLYERRGQGVVQSASLGWLEGPNGAWSIRRDDSVAPARMRFTPCDGGAILTMVIDWLIDGV